MAKKSKTENANPVGRPPTFSTPEEMRPLIDAYFAECDATTPKRPYTVPGLAYALGLNSRQALFEYEKRPEFFDTIKGAKLRIEQQRAEQLVSEGHTAGKIFDLKNNFGWEDRSTTEHEITKVNLWGSKSE